MSEENIKNKQILGSVKKTALILIAFGFILGSVVGFLQTPPEQTETGWQIAEADQSNRGHILMIPDTNGNGGLDVLQFIDANILEYHQENKVPENIRWENTSGCILFDGLDGRILEEIQYSAPYQIFTQWGMDNLICGNNGYSYAPVCQVADFSKGVSTTGYYNLSTIEIIKISHETLEIVDSINLIEAGLESNYSVLNPPTEGDSGDWISYSPELRMISNPNNIYSFGSYSGDVLVYKNTLSYGEDNDPLNFHLLNPETFEILGVINTSRIGLDLHQFGFAMVAVNSTQQRWVSPYFYIYEFNNTINGDGKINVGIIDEVAKIDPITINWTMANYSISTYTGITDHANNDIYPELKLVVSLDEIGNYVAFTSLLKYTAAYSLEELGIDKGLIPDSEFGGQEPYYYNNLKFDEMVDQQYVTMASEINSFNFAENSVPEVMWRFNSSTSLIYAGGNPNQYIVFDGEPIIEDIVPIKLGNSSEETSIAVIAKSFEYSQVDIDGYVFPQKQISVSFIRPERVGSIYPMTPNENVWGAYYDSDIGMINKGPNWVSQGFFNNKIEYTVDFDINGDGMTDIPVMGVNIDNLYAHASDGETMAYNGPFVTFTQDNQATIQFQFTRAFYYTQLILTGDVNQDGVADAFINARALLFVRIQDLPSLGFIEAKMADPTISMIFMCSIAFIVVGFIILIIALIKYKDSGLKLSITGNKKMLITFIIVALGLLAVLFYLFQSLVSATQQGQTETQIGLTAVASALRGLLNTSAIANFTLITALPITIGLYMLLSPNAATEIVKLNQAYFAKIEGVKASLKQEAVSEDAALQKDISYKLLIVPPFGRDQNNMGHISRILSIVALGLSIGLTFFEYGVAAKYQSVSSFSSLADPFFSNYISDFFIYLVVPGLVAIPLFYWLMPTSWILDDSGILFYVKLMKNRKPEDVESVGQWFSSYLKGFLGISAIVSYIRFISQSPVSKSINNLGSDALVILLFVFGFLVFAGLAYGLLIVAFHEISLPYNMGRVYDKLKSLKFRTQTTKLDFSYGEELSAQVILDSMDKPVNSENSEKIE